MTDQSQPSCSWNQLPRRACGFLLAGTEIHFFSFKARVPPPSPSLIDACSSQSGRESSQPAGSSSPAPIRALAERTLPFMDNARSPRSENKTGAVCLLTLHLPSSAGAEEHLRDFTFRHTQDSPAQVRAAHGFKLFYVLKVTGTLQVYQQTVIHWGDRFISGQKVSVRRFGRTCCFRNYPGKHWKHQSRCLWVLCRNWALTVFTTSRSFS